MKADTRNPKAESGSKTEIRLDVPPASRVTGRWWIRAADSVILTRRLMLEVEQNRAHDISAGTGSARFGFRPSVFGFHPTAP